MSETKIAAGEPGRRERKRLEQLDRIADLAWRLFDAEGFEAITMERIAEVADVSKVTLYRYFPVKEALLRHVIHRELRQAWPDLQPELTLQPPGRARLARFFDAHALWCEAHKAYLPHYVRFRMSDTRLPDGGHERSGMDRIFTELIAQGQAAGDLRADIPAEQLAMHLQFVHLATLLRWLSTPGSQLRDELARMLDLVCTGMGARP